MTGISGPAFTQNLSYNAGGGNSTKCYNGNISSMTWKVADDASLHGYQYSYDGLNRMSDATYGQGTSLNSNVDHFSEKVTGYDKNGNILGLKRYGRTGASSYGLIDDLSYSLNGNQLLSVNDAAGSSAYNNSFEFTDGAKTTLEYAYDANGNLTKDLNKSISLIQYNYLNLPSSITFSDGSVITYTYSADGGKLRTVHQLGTTVTTRDYCGNVVYENGTAKQLLTDEGYVSLNDNKYRYYLKDHQGNNRVVINQTGAVEETNHYYPFGGVFASTGNVQPYKYNGKELDTQKGLNWYDYGARHYDAALGRFTTVDPLAEMSYSVSTHTYCFNNPANFTDPTGCFASTHTDSIGNIIEVYNDGDLGVYRHDKDREGTVRELDEQHSSTNTAAGGEKMGETEYWDEFGTEGHIISNARIFFGSSWDISLERLNKEANGLGLAKVAKKSLPGKKFDIKRQKIYFAPNGPATGRLLKGKYATARSAGNFLAGMNGATGTFLGRHISLEMYMRLAGGLHVVESRKTNPTIAPYYGEIPYAGRMIIAGFNYGLYKMASRNWLTD